MSVMVILNVVYFIFYFYLFYICYRQAVGTDNINIFYLKPIYG